MLKDIIDYIEDICGTHSQVDEFYNIHPSEVDENIVSKYGTICIATPSSNKFNYDSNNRQVESYTIHLGVLTRIDSKLAYRLQGHNNCGEIIKDIVKYIQDSTNDSSNDVVTSVQIDYFYEDQYSDFFVSAGAKIEIETIHKRGFCDFPQEVAQSQPSL